MGQILTLGFLTSFGLIQRTKNGWHELKVFIRASSDLLNCVPRVGGFLRVSLLAAKSFSNSTFKNCSLEVLMSLTKSGLKVSLFLSKKPANEKMLFH